VSIVVRTNVRYTKYWFEFKRFKMRRKIANARIDMRTTPQRKHFLEMAAFIGGYDSLSSFMVEASETLAKKVFDSIDERRELSAKDRDLLLSFLQNSPEPNEALKKAFASVKKLYQFDDNGLIFYNVPSNMIK
jgi:uncharacterized protein (DUF1778 family)